MPARLTSQPLHHIDSPAHSQLRPMSNRHWAANPSQLTLIAVATSE
jgi:hypothetical protein